MFYNNPKVILSAALLLIFQLQIARPNVRMHK